jgi:cytidyltransferase-like protein
MRVVCVSGYFDPLHVGHLEYLEKAKQLGDILYVIVNNDLQAALKKGKSFMPEQERLRIVRSLACVDAAILACDRDRTVCETLRIVRPDAFANGGDQTNASIPEAPVCHELGIELIDGLGDKIQSSSWLTGLTAKKVGAS